MLQLVTKMQTAPTVTLDAAVFKPLLKQDVPAMRIAPVVVVASLLQRVTLLSVAVLTTPIAARPQAFALSTYASQTSALVRKTAIASAATVLVPMLLVSAATRVLTVNHHV